MSEELINKINEILENKKDAVINIVNDRLTISVFTLLEKNLKNVKEINFIIRGMEFIPKNNEISHEFEMTPNDVLYNSYEIKEKNKLSHFAKAKAMHDFIEKNVNIRKVNSGIKVNGNLLMIDNDFMIQGSSSLEILKKNNVFNFDTYISEMMDKSQIEKMLSNYKTLWNSNQHTVDYKKELLESLEFVYREHSPEFLYYFTLNELFGHQLDNGIEYFEKNSDKFKRTEIWNSLFDFQKDCVVSAINKLQKYNGCIIADSVGLGKTYEALAVIKYFELRNDNVLVLTPKKLYENWNSFAGNYTDGNLDEIFNYKIMYHTDLSRYKGESKTGQDLSRFNWSNFDLIVIDESHNFRNRNDRYDDENKLIMNRYSRLLQEVIKKGRNTKVLLLSATPVNNSLVDLKNQLSIITGDRDFAFEESGINSVNYTLKKSSEVINSWEKENNHKKEELLDKLPSDFYKLLEMMTISRSRKHITNYYGTGDVGKFPNKNKPKTFYTKIDKNEKFLDFKTTNELLEELTLAVYTPIRYIKSEYIKSYTEKYDWGRMNFTTQSKGTVMLHRFNLFKRLESSVFSFSETLKRLLNRIDSTIEILEKDTVIKENMEMEEDEIQEEIYIENKYEINIKHLRKEHFIEDLLNDRNVIQMIYDETKKVLDEKRDNKIEELEKIVSDKIRNTPYNSGNKKVLIFTAFADTAEYLYNELRERLRDENVNLACITGQIVKTTNKNVRAEFNKVLSAFSPISKMKKELPENEQIDILIGTDCISEGQNLQDCDTVINFDIHWNPVSLIQRFGRVDRIGSKNKNIQMINFFPNMELNDYLKLEQRVKGKMTTLNIVSTGDEDVLTPEMNDFNFRKRQLERLKDEVIDLEDTNENISLTDLNMNEYLYELSEYVKMNKEINKIPKGIYSVAEGEKKGVLFCFKHSKENEKPKSDSSLYPYYLIYMNNNGEVLYGNVQARETVKLFRKLCYGKDKPIKELFKIFDEKTKNKKDMRFYSNLLNKGIVSIKGLEEEKAIQSVFDFGGFENNFENDTAEDFELISFLVVE